RLSFFSLDSAFKPPPPPAISTLSLHDALPISCAPGSRGGLPQYLPRARAVPVPQGVGRRARRRPRSGGVCPSAGAQTGERAGVALHRGGKHGEEPPPRVPRFVPQRLGARAGMALYRG